MVLMARCDSVSTNVVTGRVEESPTISPAQCERSSRIWLARPVAVSTQAVIGMARCMAAEFVNPMRLKKALASWSQVKIRTARPLSSVERTKRILRALPVKRQDPQWAKLRAGGAGQIKRGPRGRKPLSLELLLCGQIGPRRFAVAAQIDLDEPAVVIPHSQAH